MAINDLVPWKRGRAVSRAGEDSDPFLSLHRQMNRLFDDMARDFGMNSLLAVPRTSLLGTGLASSGWPALDVHDGENEVKIVAELPGLEEKDVELSIHDGMLTIKGEKKAAEKNAHYSERWYGSFERAITLGEDVDPDKVSATFKNGVLTVTFGKRPVPERKTKHIPINHG